jgi:hypothetical protein
MRNEEGIYNIREHKTKGLMLPSVKEQKFITDIPMSDRETYANVGQF